MVGRLRAAAALPGLPAAAFLAGLYLVFLPAQAYEGNAPFLHFGLAQVLVVLVPMFLVAFLLLAAVAALGGARARRVTASILVGLGAASWATATFMTSSQGMMDGRAGLQLAFPFQSLMASITWALVAILAALLAWRHEGVTRRLFVALLIVHTAQVAWIGAKDRKEWGAAPSFEQVATLSQEGNVLVLLLDAFQSDFFEEITHSRPKLAEAFEGFTFFPNAAGNAMTTYLAMPAIHSGARITNGKGIAALYEREVVEGSFVAKLASAGWDAVLVNPILDRCPRGATCGSSELLIHGRELPLLETGILLVNFAAFRALPHKLKPAIYNNGAWWLPLRLYTDFAATSNAVLDRLAAETRGGNPRRAARFLHLFSTHGPASFDGACEPVQGAPWDRRSAIAQCECALSKVAALLDALRARGLYDATTLVVLADHGSGLPADEASGFLLGAGGSPLLLVKPAGSRGPMKTSPRVVGLADVAATVCTLSGGCKAAHGIDVMAPGERAPDYPFLTYVWDATYYGADEVPLDNLYRVRGAPRSVGSWWRETNLPVRVTSLDFSGTDNGQAYGFGWAGFELYGGQWMRWSVGPESDVYLNLEPGRDSELEIEAKTHPGNLPQTMAVEVNGHKVGEVSLSTEFGKYRIRVPASAVRKQADRVLFRPRHAQSPAPADPRQLGVLFIGLDARPL